MAGEVSAEAADFFRLQAGGVGQCLQQAGIALHPAETARLAVDVPVLRAMQQLQTIAFITGDRHGEALTAIVLVLPAQLQLAIVAAVQDRKSTRLNSSH